MSFDTIAVLLVEDNSEEAAISPEALTKDAFPPFKLTPIKSLSEALQSLAAERFDAVLLACSQPGSQVFDMLVRIREQAPRMPVVILASSADEALALKAIQLGAQDFLVKKWANSYLVGRALHYAVERHRLLVQIEQNRYREMGLLERLSSPPRAAVTAQTYGQVRVHESAPELFGALVQQYETLLDMALEQQTYRVDHHVSESLNRLAEHLGFLRAGPRDVIELHRTALKTKIRSVTPQKGHAYLEEGRLLVLELMGDLVSFYRNFALGVKDTPRPKASTVSKQNRKQRGEKR